MKNLYLLRPLFFQKLIWIPTRLVLSTFGNLTIKGLENLNAIEKNAIFALNHISEVDAFFLPGSLPFWSRFSPIFYTAAENKEFRDKKFGWKRFFYGGFIFKSLGSYPLKVGLQDYHKSMESHIQIVKDGYSMCIFPEGGITSDGNIQPSKGGVAYLAYITNTPIVPVRISGSYRMELNKFLRRQYKLSITYGKPIYIQEGIITDINVYKQIANRVMEDIRSL